MGNAILSFSFARVTEVRHINSCITKGRGGGGWGGEKEEEFKINGSCRVKKIKAFASKKQSQQECIQVGCVPPTAVAVPGGADTPLGADPPRVDTSGSSHPPPEQTPPR